MHPKKLIFSALFLLLGLGVLVFGLMKVLEASATKDWTSVEGQMIESVAVRQTGSKKTYPYEVRVRYAYEFDGQAYVGERYDVHGAFKAESGAEAQRKTEEWAAGEPVGVHVDPGDPASAVLATGGVGRSWIILVMGVLLCIAGVFSAVARTR